MELTSRQASNADAQKVLSDLSEQTTAEFKTFGKSPNRFVAEAIHEGQRIWLLEADVPLALYAFQDHGPYLSMWFIA
jgi:hypothetical protein